MRRNARLIVALFLASMLALVVPAFYQGIWRLFVPFIDDDPSNLRQRSLVFIKVHKTGSSTIANILQRYGHRNGLNFALPNKTVGEIRYNYFGGIGGTLDRSQMIPSKRSLQNSGFNILFNHVVYNWTAFVEIFPPNNSSYVTMIREPVSHFESSLLYFVHDDIFKVATENTTEYLENPALYEPDDAYISFTNNRQALDLGIPPRQLRNAKYVETYIKLLDKTMDLVMITEYFDESLIMLKRKFSLQLRDIIYIHKNKKYQSFDFKFSSHDLHFLKGWLLADDMIYQHFYLKFHLTLKNEVQIMEETAHFKQVLEKTWTFCEGNEQTSRLPIEESQWNTRFELTALDCAYMNLSELDFLNKLLHDR